VPQVGQRRCGRFGCPQLGQTFTFGAAIACVARRLSRRDLEVFRFGTAITAAHYSLSFVNTAEILDLFDRQMRRDVVDEDGLYVGDGWNAVLWPSGDFARAVARLRELPGHCEWKLYGHDPADLPERLLAAGLEPEDEETVLVAEAAAIPEMTGVDVELATDAFVELAGRVFGRRYELPKDAVAVVAIVDGVPVSGGRVDFPPNTDFAGLYGGVTLPELRGRGLYRATVAARARLARERGYRYLTVDALPTSRPILERVGFVRLTTTTPYVFPAELAP
jgi:GNAT superfamily N-acetyltransferase